MAVVIVASACGDSDSAESAGRSEQYTSEIDGISVRFPATWHRAETPLAAAQTGRQVEVLGLATARLPDAERGCSPLPWAAMQALSDGDLVLTVHVSDDPHDVVEQGREPLASKPDDLLDIEPMAAGELPGGCAVDGVEQREAQFLAHSRRYWVFLASHGALDDQRRDELRAVWSSLTLDPIIVADESAPAGKNFWHVLYTHCGITETQFAGRDWVADPALHDGNHNPPPGWANPYQPGVMTLEGADRASFESRDGQLGATFRLRTDTDPPPQTCE